MRRYPSRGPSHSSFSFGPGPLTPAIKILIVTNVALFLLMWLMPAGLTQAVQEFFGLVPAAIFESLRVWQPVTYMFLHDTSEIGHILINMLALWMFGTELERMWGTKAFLRYYFATGIAAAITTILVSLAPFPATARMFYTVTIGASGAIYGLLLAYGLTFPNRPIYIYFIFAIPAKYFVMIMGAIALFSSMGNSGAASRTSHIWAGWSRATSCCAAGASAPPTKCVIDICAGRWTARERSSACTRAGKAIGTSMYTETTVEKRRSSLFVFRSSFFLSPSLPTDYQRQ